MYARANYASTKLSCQHYSSLNSPKLTFIVNPLLVPLQRPLTEGGRRKRKPPSQWLLNSTGQLHRWDVTRTELHSLNTVDWLELQSKGGTKTLLNLASELNQPGFRAGRGICLFRRRQMCCSLCCFYFSWSRIANNTASKTFVTNQFSFYRS